MNSSDYPAEGFFLEFGFILKILLPTDGQFCSDNDIDPSNKRCFRAITINFP
jgi:hypothetical protein